MDFIYVGTSGTIQPALPLISKEARDMQIPVVNSDFAGVLEGQVLCSVGINHRQMGFKAGNIGG